MSIKDIQLENFTVFKETKVKFSSGVNVLIGENGTGKTHVMKLIYAVLLDPTARNLNEYFKVKARTDLFNDEMKDAKLSIGINGVACGITFYGLENGEEYKKNQIIDEVTVLKHMEGTPTGVFIPAKDMLTHSRGLLEMASKYGSDMPFDKTLLDVIELSKRWKVDGIPELGRNILPKIEEIIGGKVIVENDTFYIEKTNGKKIEFSTEAEGIKKIALIWQLIMNEGITSDSVLFWDEPEANINPSILKDIAEILLELSRNGVQVFVATHNYVFAKYIEVMMNDKDEVAFHALYDTQGEGVQCETKDKFTLLTHNLLRTENVNLYDAEMKKESELWSV